MKTLIQNDIYTPMFIATLFIIAKTWKKPKSPSRDEWTQKNWYGYTWNISHEKNRNINKTYLENLNRNQNETLEWKSTKQKNESGSLKIGQLKYLSPRNRRKKD